MTGISLYKEPALDDDVKIILYLLFGYASSSLSSSLHKIVLKIERSQITVTAAQLFWNVSGYHINARAFPILQYEGGLD